MASLMFSAFFQRILWRSAPERWALNAGSPPLRAVFGTVMVQTGTHECPQTDVGKNISPIVDAVLIFCWVALASQVQDCATCISHDMKGVIVFPLLRSLHA